MQIPVRRHGKDHSKGKRSRSPKRPFLVTGSAFNLPADVGTLISRDRQLLRCFFGERLNCDIGGHFKGFEAIPKTHATHESHESYANQSREADHRMRDDRLFAGVFEALIIRMQASLRKYQGALDTGRPDSWEPGARSQEPGARSQEPGARSHFDFYFVPHRVSGLGEKTK